MNSVKDIVEHTLQLARIEQEKKKRKHRRQQLKNQARCKQRQSTLQTNTETHNA